MLFVVLEANPNKKSRGDEEDKVDRASETGKGGAMLNMVETK